jgi:2-oxoglutarate ferredoxin oxidoreductase subunit gamma
VRKEIVIAGVGGQGVQRLGEALAKALHEQGFLVSLKSEYGPEARGGASFSQVVVKESPEDWPEILQVDILVAMAQEGYNAWIHKTTMESIVLFDDSLVESVPLLHTRQYPIPAGKVASELGSQIVANMVMLGAVAAVSGLLALEDIAPVVEKSARKFAGLNLEAVKQGYELGSLFEG